MATNKEIIQFTAKGLKKVESDIRALEKQVKKLDRAYKSSTKSSKGVTSSMGGMIAKLGLGYLAFRALTGAISGVVRVGKDFEKEMSNVEAISGATAKQMQALEKNARDLGSTTVFTATNVASLQTEFAKLGFTAKEITKVTKGTLDLASVARVDLAQAAAVAGTTLRAFGLNVEETGRVTDVMALSFSRSALDIQKFTDSMKFVAPVAKEVGFTVEGTTAIMGALANAGIDGSLAGTALRTIFLKLADTNSALSKRLGGSVKSAEELIPALKKLKDSGVDLTEMLGLVDKRAVTAFSILVDGTDKVGALKNELDNAAGSAKRMADIQLDNLAGKVTLMNSAMEGLGIRLFEFVEGPLNSAVTGLTNFANAMDAEALKSYTVAFTGVGGAILIYNSAMVMAKLRTIQFQATLVKTGWGALIVGAGLAVGKLLEMSDVFGDINKEAKELEASLGDLSRRTFAQLSSAEQQKKIVDTKKHLLTLYEEGSKGAKTFKGFIDSLSKSIHKQGLSTKKAEELATKAIKHGLLKRIEAQEEVATIVTEKTKEQLSKEAAIYENFLVERAGLENFGFEIQKQAAAEQYVALVAMSEQYNIDLTELQNFNNKKMIQLDAAAVSARLSIHSGLATGLAAAAGQFAGGLKISARLQQVAAVIDAYAAMNKAMSAYPPPYNFVAAAAVGATAFANVMSISQSIGEFKSAATGADEVVTRPTMFLTGEAGAEHVQVTPLGGAGSAKGSGAGAGSIVINISAPLVDETVIDSIIPAIAKAQRLGLA